MVKNAFCDVNADAKIGVLLTFTIVSILSVAVVCMYALCYVRRRKMICQQRLYEASEREMVAYQDVNLLLTYMAHLQRSGVKLEPPPHSSSVSASKKDDPVDRRQWINDSKLEDQRKEILQRVLCFYGYDPPSGPQPKSLRSPKSRKSLKAPAIKSATPRAPKV